MAEIETPGAENSYGEESAGQRGRRFYMTREPLILAALVAVAVVFFAAVTGLSHVYQTQQGSLGDRWFMRGVSDLKAGRYRQAVSGFRTALLYGRDNDIYQLDLAEALMGTGRRSEAEAYLVNLWEREPENGQVNLDLARVAAQAGETERALRYYHNAIYATWNANQSGKRIDDQEAKRREARLELVRFLLKINDRTQAQAELIAMSANLGDNAAEHLQVGKLFLQAGDYEHALAEFGMSLRKEQGDPAALAGAGQAEFEMRRYGQAARYLQAAATANPEDAQAAEELKESELVVRMNPFQPRLPLGLHVRMVMEAFAVAGERLNTCAVAGGSATAGSSGGTGSTAGASTAGAGQSLAEQWTKMKPQITARQLHRDPELEERAMDLVFEIEHRSAAQCGNGSDKDMALLRIANLHQ